jgi:hypothetical protein
MHPFTPTFLAATLFAGACTPLPLDPTTLAPGAASANIDGASWATTEATWTEAGSSIQINTGSADGWWITLVASTTEDGEAALDQLERRKFPMVFTLADSGAGAFATLYPAEGGSYSTNAAGGTLWITGSPDSGLQGSFEFDAVDRDDQIVPVRRGGFWADPLPGE